MEEIKKFITAYQDISELKERIYDIEKGVEKLEGEVIKRIIEIRNIRGKVYKNKPSGRVAEVCYINNSTIEFEVSYCGCCENNREELDMELLLMDDKLVIKHFTDEKKISDDIKLKEKKEKEAKDKEELELHDKNNYKRLKKKYG